MRASSLPAGASARTGAGGTLAAAAALAAGTAAYAEPIRFDNPGNAWDWEPGYSIFGRDPRQFLDLTLPPAEQGAATFLNYTNITQGAYSPYYSLLYSYGGFLSVDDSVFDMARGVPAGTPIGTPGQSFAAVALIATTYGGNTTSLIPEGVRSYIGGRIVSGSGYHSAWVGVVRSGLELDAFAWGYETVANTPIAAGAPEPGTLAMLALGAVAGLGRGR